MSREAIQLHEQITRGAIDVAAPLRFLRRMAPLASDYLGSLDFDAMVQQLSTSAGAVAGFIASRALGIGQDAVRFTALFFLMLYFSSSSFATAVGSSPR